MSPVYAPPGAGVAELPNAGTYVLNPPVPATDNRASIEAQIAATPANSTILVPGLYPIAAPWRYKTAGRRYVGVGVAENGACGFQLMNGANPTGAVQAVAVAEEWDASNLVGGTPVVFENLHIDGNSANNTGTYGCLLLFSHWSRVFDCRFDSPRLDHIILTKLAKNGSGSSQDHADNWIYNNRLRLALAGTDGAGIRHISSGGAGNHNMDIRALFNHMESMQHGIVTSDAAGWTVLDNHIWARRHGINMDSGFLASKIIGNYIDGFGNENTAATTYYGIRARGFDGHGSVVAFNNVDITENITTGIFYCYYLEAQNAGAHIAGGGNLAYGHATPNAAHHGFMFTATNGTVINGQDANTAVGFVAGQDFEVAGAGTITRLYPRPLSGTAAWTPGAIAGGAGATQSVTVTGAALGDPVAVGYNQNLADGIVLTGEVSAANTVTAQLRNVTGGSITPTAGTVRATVWKY